MLAKKTKKTLPARKTIGAVGASGKGAASKSGWGGARPGAGRKPRDPSRPRVPHVTRAVQDGRRPLAVILRAVPGLPAFGEPRLAKLIGEVIQDVTSRRVPAEFLVLDVKVEAAELHLVVQASSVRDVAGHSALRSGTSAVAIAFARRLNMMLGRKGKVWETRYEVTAVQTSKKKSASTGRSRRSK